MSAKKRKPRRPSRAEQWQINYDERNSDRGIVKVAVRIPESKREELLQICSRWRSALK